MWAAWMRQKGETIVRHLKIEIAKMDHTKSRFFENLFLLHSKFTSRDLDETQVETHATDAPGKDIS